MSTPAQIFENHLRSSKRLHVEQVREGFEIVLGWETRNKYRILDEERRPLAYAAEQSKGILSSILRNIVGHWRSFDVTIFNENREAVYLLNFPFRWFFKTLYMKDSTGRPLGHLQQRFAILRKKFDVYDANGQQIANINSSFFRFWTFDFFRGSQKIGSVQKKWSGALNEFFTDKDNFVVEYPNPLIEAETKSLMLATCLMVDIIYFETKSRGGLLDLID